MARIVREAGAGVVLRPNRGEHGTLFVLGRDVGEGAVPSVVLSAEHYNMIARMIERGIAVKLRVNVQTRFLTDDKNGYNVNMDTFERVREADLKQAAIVMASFIYNASVRQDKIPAGKK